MENDKPTLYIIGTQDEYCAPERLDLFERRLPPSSQVRRVEGADHFFIKQLDQVQQLITEFFFQLRLEAAV